MGRKKKSLTINVLMILWLVTAATALIVTVVYFGEITEMYTAVTDAGEKGVKNPANTGSDVSQVADNTAGTKENVDEKTPVTPGVQSEETSGSNNDKTDTADSGEPGSGIQDSGNPGNADSGKQGEGNIGSGETGDMTNNVTENAGPGGNSTDQNNGNTDTVDSENSGNDKQDTGNPDGATGDDQSEGSTGSEENDGSGETVETEQAYYYDPTLDPSKPIIALSFDDGPSMYTKRVLAALEKYGAKATFFMVGYNLEPYADEVRAVYEAGCEVGNHTTDHSNLVKCSESEIRSKVFDNENEINKIVPVGAIPLRPPYGEYNDKVKSIVDRPMFNWSVDSLDWKTRNADSIVAQIKHDAKDGYVILMHDIYETTAEAAERIIPWLIDQGYQVTCISNMFKARGEVTKPGHLYRYTDPAPKQD